MLRLFSLVLFLLFVPVSARGQDQTEPTTPPSTPATTTEITSEVIEARRKAADEQTDLDEETKKRVADLYRQATEQLQRSKAFTAKTAEFKARADAEQALKRVGDLKSQSAAQQAKLAEVNTRLQQLAENLEDPRFVPRQELSELGQNRLARATELATLKDEQAKLESESARRVNRRKELRARLAALDKELSDVEQQLTVAAPADESPAVSLARNTEFLARKLALTNERPALESELLALDAEDSVDLIRVQRDLKIQQVSVASAELQIAEALEKRKKDAAAREQVRTARDDMDEFKSSPLLKSLAERNFALSELNQQLTKELANVREDLKLTKSKLEQLTEEYDDSRRRVDSVGLPASVGAMLRKQRSELPDTRQHRAAVRERQPKIESAQLRFYDLDEEDSQLAEKEKTLARYVEEGKFAEPTSAEAETAKLLLTRKEQYLEPLLRTQEDLFDALAELSFSEQQLIQKTEEFSDYIDERVLWIRSGQSLIDEVRSADGRVRTAQNYREAFLRVVSPANWSYLGTTILGDVKRVPGIYLAALLAFVLLFRFAVPARRRVRQIGELVQRSAFSQFYPTLKAVFLTLLIASPWPVVMTFAAWRLQLLANGNELASSLSQGLRLVAIGFFSLDTLRQLCRPYGLAESHFAWPPSAVALLRRSLRWLMVMGLPVVFLTCLVSFDETALGKNSLERLLFIVNTVLCSVFLARILHPRTGIFQTHLALYPHGWACRLRHVWYTIVIVSPLVLSGLAFVGYYYTARQLSWKIYLAIVLLTILQVVHSLVSRLLLVHRRRLSIAQAKQRRAAAAEAAAAEASPAGADASGPHVAPDTPSAEESLADLRMQTSQARRLLTTALLGAAFVGIWLTWNDVVPALGFLERWPLWQSTTQVTTTNIDDAGNAIKQTRDVIDPVTIADLTFAVLVAIITMVAARNLPGLLEISVLQQLPLETSVRYAITTLCSYTIVLIGLIVSANMIGLHWSQVQWMATALTFGLAFGLQEMFANFVAGIIILFERPIRVGDIVTLGDISGTVSRVRIRATTITNWDRKDFVVPNKDFITGRILNWTLSDQVNRVVVNVGVAYGSDTALAKSILLRIAHEHPQVVDEPPPIATFEEFGESSLTIVLRSFIAMKDMPSRLKIVDELHSTVDAEFKKAGIEIAFPQRDLHVRSFTPPVSIDSQHTPARSEEATRPSTN